MRFLMGRLDTLEGGGQSESNNNAHTRKRKRGGAVVASSTKPCTTMKQDSSSSSESEYQPLNFKASHQKAPPPIDRRPQTRAPPSLSQNTPVTSGQRPPHPSTLSSRSPSFVRSGGAQTYNSSAALHISHLLSPSSPKQGARPSLSNLASPTPSRTDSEATVPEQGLPSPGPASGLEFGLIDGIVVPGGESFCQKL